MNITLVNQTGVQKTYLSGALVLPASGSVVVPSYQQIGAATDGGLFSDIFAGNVQVSDGTNNYGISDAIEYLRLIFLSGLNDKNGSGTLTAQQTTENTPVANSTVVASTDGTTSVVFDISGTWSAFLAIDAQNGDGTWFPVAGINPANGNQFTVFAQNLQVIVPCGGYAQVRIRCYSYTSGTVTVSYNAGVGLNYLNQGIAGSLPSAWPFKLTESTGTYTAGVDPRGGQYTTPLDGFRATYSATSAIAFASASSATDIFTITGSASKTIRILRIGFSLQVTTAGIINVLLVKRSAANSGGTSAAATAVPHDSNDAGATATVLNYTANPSGLGAAVGTVRGVRIFPITSGSDVYTTWQEFEFGNLPEKAVVLRGTSQVLALNLNAATVTGGTWICFVEWTEE